MRARERVASRSVVRVSLAAAVLALSVLGAMLMAASGPASGASGPVAAGGEKTASLTASSSAKKKNKPRPCRATKRGPVLRSPGYKGACKAPKTKPGDPLPPITLSQRGRFPDMVVDAAGTAHVVWSEDGGDAEDKLRYCRIKRAAGGCDNPQATRSMFPVQPYGPGAPPSLNDDTAGPVVAAVGQDLALITFRYPIVVSKPDGASSSTTYMWVSDDGGQSATGPAIVGNLGPTGGATVFGPPDSPRIGLITDTQTGGTFFQSVVPGAYNGAQLNLGAGGPDRAYSGSLATVNQRPLAAFSDLTNHTYLRQWNGAGNPEDPAGWREGVIPGVEPDVAAGPAGAFVVNRPGFLGELQVRRVNGVSAGAPTKVADSPVGGAYDLYADPGGAPSTPWSSRTACRGIVSPLLVSRPRARLSPPECAAYA